MGSPSSIDRRCTTGTGRPARAAGCAFMLASTRIVAIGDWDGAAARTSARGWRVRGEKSGLIL
jgi:hypothetical protein